MPSATLSPLIPLSRLRERGYRCRRRGEGSDEDIGIRIRQKNSPTPMTRNGTSFLTDNSEKTTYCLAARSKSGSDRYFSKSISVARNDASYSGSIARARLNQSIISCFLPVIA